jgi:hypothetical protein
VFPNLYSIKSFVLLDTEGQRLFAKYYPTSEQDTLTKQKSFEKSLFEKTRKQSGREV